MPRAMALVELKPTSCTCGVCSCTHRSWHESGTATTRDGKPCAVALAKKQHAKFLRSHPVCCVGGTVWQLLQGRECSNDAPYNLLLVDEGSQVPMGQAALGVGLLHPTYSRVVVVGDHLQVSALVCVREWGSVHQVSLGSACLYTQMPPLLHNEYPDISEFVSAAA